MAIIAIEEHFTSPQLRKLIAPREGPIQKMLDEMGGQRIKDMDESASTLPCSPKTIRPRTTSIPKRR